MDEIYKSLSRGIKRLIDKKIKELKFDYTLTGRIKTVNSNNYTVTIDDYDTDIKARLGLSLQVGDLVYVRVIQGNFSNKFIDCKVP